MICRCQSGQTFHGRPPFSTLRCRYGPADLSQCTYRLFAAERAGSMLKSQGSDKGREKNAATRTLRPFVGKRSSTLISALMCCFAHFTPAPPFGTYWCARFSLLRSPIVAGRFPSQPGPIRVSFGGHIRVGITTYRAPAVCARTRVGQASL